MSEFSAILDVLICVVNAAFEATLDTFCGGLFLVSCLAVWRWSEICTSFSNAHTRSDYRSECLQSICLSLIDFILLPMTIFIVFSPIRWPLLQLSISVAYQFPNRYDSWDFRGEIFSTCMGSLLDVFGYFFALLILFSPFGRIKTIWLSSVYYFRPNQDFEEKCTSLNRWSFKLIQQGLATFLDLLVVMFALPCVLLVPSVWTPTYRGIAELCKPINQPSNLLHTKNFQRDWMDDWYPTLRLHLFNQIIHALTDMLLAPLSLLVWISPLRQPAMRHTIRVTQVETERENERYANRARDVSSFDYNYSHALRRQVCVLALLAVADLLLLPMLLPLWLTQYRFVALREELYPNASAPPEENSNGAEITEYSAPDEVVVAPAEVAEEERLTKAEEAETAAKQQLSPAANHFHHRDEDLEPYPEFNPEDGYPPLDYTSDLRPNEHVAPPTSPTQSPTSPVAAEDPAPRKLWGTREFFLISSQAGLLFTDIFMLALPLPLLYLSRIRWGPVSRILHQEKVFLDSTSAVYATVLGQMSMLLLDLLLAPFALLILATVYRSAALRTVVGSLALVEELGHSLHFSVLVNTLCIFHDALLLAPALLLFPCLVGYRAPIVYRIIQKHIASERQLAERDAENRDQTVVRAAAPSGLEDQVTAPLDEQVAPASPPVAASSLNLYPPWHVRGDLWEQVAYTLLDLPFLAMGAVVMLTLWRAWELVAAARYTAATRNEDKVRRAVGRQFLFLLRDVFFVVPMLIIMGTLYRLPQLLGQFMGVLLSGGASLTSSPVLDVESCHIEFPVRGGPAINFSCRRIPPSVISTIDDDGALLTTIQPTDTVTFDPAATVELHVVADSVWESAANILGKFVVSLVRSYLPLKLVDGQSIGWAEFVNNDAAAELLTKRGGDDNVTPAIGPASSLWLRLDLGTTKRSTIAKKIQSMPSNAVLRLQLETFATVTSAQGGAPQRKKVVLLRVSPTIGHLKVMLTDPENQSDPSAALAAALPLDAVLPALNFVTPEDPAEANSPKKRQGNFVNSFNTIVSQVFIEFFLDMVSLLMVLLTAFSPVRFCRLVVALLEPAGKLPLRVCANVFTSVAHIDSHLLEYRRQCAAPLNHCLKSKLPEILQHAWSSLNLYSGHASHTDLSFIGYFDEELSQHIRKIEKYHLRAYRSLCKSTLKSLGVFPGCDEMEALLTERLKLQDRLISLWFLRIAAEVFLLHGLMEDAVAKATLHNSAPVSPSSTPSAPPRATAGVALRTDHAVRFDLALLVLTQEHDKVAHQLTRNEAYMKSLVERLKSAALAPPVPATPLTLRKRFKQTYTQCGLFTRPIAESRKLILVLFLQAMSDLGFLCLLVLLLVTLVRTLPLLKELHQHRAWSPLRYTTRWILIKNVKLLYSDLKEIARLSLFVLVLLITVGGVPSFLTELPFHMSSYYAAAECAKRHAKKVFQNICSVLSLVFAFRTYRIVFKAALYCAIIPGACLAEAVPWTELSAAVRFSVGLAVWAGLLIGSVFVTTAAVVDDDASSADATQYSRMSLLSWCAALFGVLLAAALSVSVRHSYQRPDCRAIRSLELSWSHILAVLTGPVESIQLSAVVLYFFWNYARAHGGNGLETDASGTGVVSTLGSDSFSAVLLVWAPSPHSDGGFSNGVSSSEDGASETGFRNSVMVAALMVLAWALLVAAPIATSSSEGAIRRAKVLAFKSAPVYEFLMVALSRLLTVWIIATLMRSTSCVHVNNTTDDGTGFAVISTAQQVSCGEGDWWASLASLSLLTYYMLTSSVLHADDADLLRNSQSDANLSAVKFAPLYALGVRMVQFFVCTACFAGFYAESALIPLVPILVVVVFGSILPGLITLRQRRTETDVSVCSVGGISTLRSAGFLCVGWTAIVCIVRASGRAQHGVWQSEATLYVGWGMVYAIALVWVVYEETRRAARWAARVKESGLDVATNLLLETIHSATVSESVYGRLLNPQNHAALSGGAVFESRTLKLRPRTLELYRARVQNVHSFEELARLLLAIEEDILAERLSTEFLLQRLSWAKSLDEIITHAFSDEVETPPTPQAQRSVALVSRNFNHRSQHSQPGLRVLRTGDQDQDQELGPDDLQHLAGLMELGFSEPQCRRGLRETRGQGVEAAVEWIMAHQDLSDYSESPDAHSPVRSAGNNSAEDATQTADASLPPVTSRTAQRLLVSIQTLRRGIKSDPSVTHLSRQVVTIFLSRRLPNEVCWLIFSYTLSSEEIERIVLGPGSADPYSSDRDLTLRASALTTSAMLRRAGMFLSNQQKRLLDAKISTPDTLQG